MKNKAASTIEIIVSFILVVIFLIIVLILTISGFFAAIFGSGPVTVSPGNSPASCQLVTHTVSDSGVCSFYVTVTLGTPGLNYSTLLLRVLLLL